MGDLTYPSLVLPFFVSVEGQFVLSGGQRRNVNMLDTFEGHCGIWLLGFEEIDHHVEPEHTDTLVILLGKKNNKKNAAARFAFLICDYISPASQSAFRSFIYLSWGKRKIILPSSCEDPTDT